MNSVRLVCPTNERIEFVSHPTPKISGSILNSGESSGCCTKDLKKTNQGEMFISEDKQNNHPFDLLQLPDDIILFILTYCQPQRLLRMAQVCRYMNNMIFNVKSSMTNHLWKQMCLFYLHRPHMTGEAESTKEKLRNEVELNLRLEEGIDNWLDQYKLIRSYAWDPSSSNHSRVLDFTNEDRTVENPHGRGSYWATTRAARTLTAGHSYRWEIEINVLPPTLGNSWRIIVGVESPLFPFIGQSNADVIGYQPQNLGAGLIIGQCHAICRGERIDPEISNLTLGQGDIIEIVFDMTLSSETNDKMLEELSTSNTENRLMSQSHKGGARMEFYLLRNEERTRILVINNIRGQGFYPAVSMNQGMKTTIQPASWL